jgi:hypothetical protein
MRCIRRNQVLGLAVARGMLLRVPRYALILLFSLVTLTACSLENKDSSNAAPPPPTPGAAKPETVAPIPSAMDTFRALAPPDGLKFTPLFSENITDTNARLKRLEDSVQTIRNDVDTLAPTMVRMVAIEKDIKGLVAQLQTLSDQSPQGAPAFVPVGTPSKLPPALPQPQQQGATPIPGEDVAKGTEPAKADEAKAGPDATSKLVTPEAASKGELPPEDAASPNSKVAAADVKLKGLDLSPKSAASPPSGDKLASAVEKTATESDDDSDEAPQKTAQGNVVNMRIADLSDKTQLTLDVTSQAAAPVKLIDKDKTLVIDLAHFKWTGAATWQSDHRKLITNGYVKNGKLYVELSHASDVKAEKIVAPSGDEKNYRLVISLFKKKVQKAAEHKAIVPAASAPKTTVQAPVQAPAAVPAPAPAPPTSGADFP